MLTIDGLKRLGISISDKAFYSGANFAKVLIKDNVISIDKKEKWFDNFIEESKFACCRFVATDIIDKNTIYTESIIKSKFEYVNVDDYDDNRHIRPTNIQARFMARYANLAMEVLKRHESRPATISKMYYYKYNRCDNKSSEYFEIIYTFAYHNR